MKNHYFFDKENPQLISKLNSRCVLQNAQEKMCKDWNHNKGE